MAKKTLQEKLHPSGKFPEIVTVSKAMLGAKVGDTMVIVSPMAYYEKMAQISAGKVKTIASMRAEFAQQYKVTFACPLTAGIFVNIVANAAEEEALQGKKDTVPWWRTVRTNGELNEKFPGGVEEQKRRLEAEGVIIMQKGKKHFVEPQFFEK